MGPAVLTVSVVQLIITLNVSVVPFSLKGKYTVCSIEFEHTVYCEYLGDPLTFHLAP